MTAYLGFRAVKVLLYLHEHASTGLTLTIECKCIPGATWCKYTGKMVNAYLAQKLTIQDGALNKLALPCIDKDLAEF